MRSKIVRAGNSRAVIIPAPVADAQRFEVGDEIEIDSLASGVMIHPVGRRSPMTAYKRVVKDHDKLFRMLAKR